jgi:integrase/recombinase XerD
MAQPTHVLVPSAVGYLDMPNGPTADPLTLAIAGFLARYKGQTFLDYQHDLNQYLRWCRDVGLAPLEAKRPHLELYIRWMEEQPSRLTGLPWKPATISRRFGTVATFYRYARTDDIIPKDPAEFVDRPPVDKTAQYRPSMSPLEHGIFMDAAEKFSPMAHALIALLGGRGLRIAEACALNIEDLSQARGYTMITFVGKGAKKVTIPLAVPVAEAVFTAIGDRTAGPILLNQWRRRMTRQVASRLIRQVAESAVLPSHVTPHSFRRAFCQTMLAFGVPLTDVQDAMRHSDPKTTLIYDQRRKSPDRDASHALSGFLAGMRG